MATELQRFKEWATKMSKNDTLLVHFYIRTEKSRFLDPPDCFLINILSSDNGWLIKGTPGHGVPFRQKRSPIPCFNMFKVDDEFYKALAKYYQNQGAYSRYEYAIILSKQRLKGQVKEIIDVEARFKEPRSLAEAYHIDNPKARRALLPFNRCNVVRAWLSINRFLQQPIIRLDPDTILGIMVQYGQKAKFSDLLAKKGLSHVRLFSL